MCKIIFFRSFSQTVLFQLIANIVQDLKEESNLIIYELFLIEKREKNPGKFLLLKSNKKFNLKNRYTIFFFEIVNMRLKRNTPLYPYSFIHRQLELELKLYIFPVFSIIKKKRKKTYWYSKIGLKEYKTLETGIT